MAKRKNKNIILPVAHTMSKALYNTWLLYVLLISILAAATYYLYRANSSPLEKPPINALYKQPEQPIDARVENLMNYMTLEEKIGQMALVDKNSLKKIEDIGAYNLGGILSGAGSKPKNNTPEGWHEMVSGMKEQARKSRLGIPIFYGIDANHGNGNVPGSTIFPHAIGLGAANDIKLTESVATATAEEIATTGINWSYSPSLDAPLDIRWGRVYEAFSDDPALNARYGAAFIQGTQAANNTDSSKSRVSATAKHYLGTGSMQWGQSKNKGFKIDQGVIPAREDLLDSHYLPPYAAAANAGVASVMVGLSFWGDTRVIDNKHLVTEKLKDQLGFKGFVVSDWYGMYEFSGKSQYKASAETINAGVDMGMLPFEYKGFIKDVRRGVNQGEISQERIDDAVRRILYQKFKTGLFDEVPNSFDPSTIGTQKNHALARKAVAASSVLLKNENSTLPISKDAAKNILVAGSGADNTGRQSGAWTIEWQGVDGNNIPGATSILQGIREVAGTGSTVKYDKEARFENTTLADVAVAIVSEKPYAEGFGDNPNPSLEELDKKVIERLRTRSKKVVIVVISGRPLLMTDQVAQADAVVASWLPGSEGGGIADVLFGDQPFRAKLPLPWPTTLSQIPTTINGITADSTQSLYDRGFGIVN